MRRFLLASLFLVGACRRAPSPSASAPEARALPQAQADAASQAPAVVTVLPAAELVMAIGDLHGDLDATRRALRLAGAIDDQDHWAGGRRVVVQTGDVLDRGDDERAIMELFERLRQEAKRGGGAFLPLSGNHEVMNVQQDFRYVTPGGFRDFDGPGGRAQGFRPGGRWATLLASWPIVAVVGDTLFVHGGVLEKHADYGTDRINREVASWMRGATPAAPAVVVAEDGPVWTRLYSTEPGQAECGELARVLAKLRLKRMVVGHTPQQYGISSACEGQVIRIDVGMARAYGGPVQVLELRQGGARALGEGAEASSL